MNSCLKQDSNLGAITLCYLNFQSLINPLSHHGRVSCINFNHAKVECLTNRNVCCCTIKTRHKKLFLRLSKVLSLDLYLKGKVNLIFLLFNQSKRLRDSNHSIHGHARPFTVHQMVGSTVVSFEKNMQHIFLQKI